MKVIQKFQMDCGSLVQSLKVERAITWIDEGRERKDAEVGGRRAWLLQTILLLETQPASHRLSSSCLGPSPWRPHIAVYLSKGQQHYLLTLIMCLAHPKSPPTALRAGPIIIAILQMENLRLRKAKSLAQGIQMAEFRFKPRQSNSQRLVEVKCHGLEKVVILVVIFFNVKRNDCIMQILRPSAPSM